MGQNPLIYRSHALRGNAAGDALRHAPLERCRIHSHAERGNDKIRVGWVERQRNPSLFDAVMGFTLFYPSYEFT